MTKEKPDRIIAWPRNYALAHHLHDSKVRVYYSPITQVRAGAYITPKDTIRENFEHSQRYCLNQIKKFKEEGYKGPERDLLDWGPYGTAENLYEFFEKSVAKKEDSPLILESEPEVAIKEFDPKGNSLTGEVRSKGKPKEDKPSVYEPKIIGQFLDNGRLPYVRVYDTCKDSGWTFTKGGQEFESQNFDIHSFALLNHVIINRNSIPQIPKGKSIFSPFRFPFNKMKQNGNIRYRNERLQAIEDSALFHYYMFPEKNQTEVNKVLLKTRDIYPNYIIKAVEDGIIKFEIVWQRTSHKGNVEELKRFLNNIVRGLKTRGYEFKGHFFELGLPAERYESKNYIIGLILSEEYPPLYTVRKKSHGKTEIFSEEQDVRNPFEFLANREKRLSYRRVDDHMKKTTKMHAGIPSMIWVPETNEPLTFTPTENNKKEYQDMVKRLYKDDSEIFLKEFALS